MSFLEEGKFLQEHTYRAYNCNNSAWITYEFPCVDSAIPYPEAASAANKAYSEKMIEYQMCQSDQYWAEQSKKL
jgi:hypothetical protein